MKNILFQEPLLVQFLRNKKIKNRDGLVNLDGKIATNDRSQPYLDRLKNDMNAQNGLLRAIVEYYNQHRHCAYVDDDALQLFPTH